MKQYQMYIDGAFVAEQRPMAQVINPATKQPISEYPLGTREDARRAIAAAKRAQPAWEALPAIERAGYLRKIAALIRRDEQRLTDVLLAEQGKTRPFANVEINFAADYLDYMAGFARSYEGEIIQSDRPNENIFLFKQAIGVTTGILPWNFPFFLIVRKLAPAFVTGNTIVLKPSSETPNVAFEFAALAHEAGVPAGVFALVSGKGSEVGDELSSHPDIGMVSITGSVEAGVRVMAAASANVIKVNLELGGKAPAIVCADADMAKAVPAILQSRICNNGQVCNCAERVYVHESRYEEFITKMREAMQNVTYGNTAEGDYDMGPLVNQAGLDNAKAMLARALEQGAKLECGGVPANDAGYFFPATLLSGCDHKSEIMQKEIFAPILPVCKFSTLDEAIAMANDCEYGLTSSIYTENLNVAMRACREIKFGETYINRENFEAMQGFHAGFRKSGIGGADGKHGLEEYLATHVVYLQYETDYRG